MRTEPSTRPAVPRRAGLDRDAHAALVLRRCVRVLLDELPDLAEALIARLRKRQPAYRAAAEEDHAALSREVRESLAHSVGSLLPSREARAAARAYTRGLGVFRARAGFPLDAVLQAFRLGGALVWERLLETVARRDAHDIPLLVQLAAGFWHFVDRHCVIVAEAYRHVERDEAWRAVPRLRRAVAELLDGSLSVAALPRAAETLGLPEHGGYAVVAVSGRDRARVRPVPAEGTVRLFWHPAERDLALVFLGEGTPRDLVRLLRGHGGVPRGARVGVSPAVSGLSAVGRARGLAETALRLSPAGRVTLLDEQLPAALLASDPDLGAALDGRVLGPLLRLEPAERDVLFRTLAAWLASDGSAQQAAARLYCHRNTVLNRLRRYEQLTGRSLSRLQDVVELSLALTARRLLNRSS